MGGESLEDDHGRTGDQEEGALRKRGAVSGGSAVLADDYTAIRADGRLGTKAQEMESLQTGNTKFESYDVHDLKIRIYGDAAIANLLFSVTGTINGKPYRGDARATRVWVRQEGAWKLVAHQATRVAPASQ